MTIEEYVNKIDKRYRAGISREHSYRGDLQNLLESLCPETLVTNEPARVACGAPDYILTKRNIPVGYIEAKDVGADLASKMYNPVVLTPQFRFVLTSLIRSIDPLKLVGIHFRNPEVGISVRFVPVISVQSVPLAVLIWFVLCPYDYSTTFHQGVSKNCAIWNWKSFRQFCTIPTDLSGIF